MFFVLKIATYYPFRASKAVMDMLSSDRLLAWFAQNPAPAFGNHKKVRAMPIGLENRCGTRTFAIL